MNSGFSIARSVGEPRGDMTWEIAIIFSSTMEIMRGFRRLEQVDSHILGKNRSGPGCLKHDRMVVISLKLNAWLNNQISITHVLTKFSKCVILIRIILKFIQKMHPEANIQSNHLGLFVNNRDGPHNRTRGPCTIVRTQVFGLF